MKSAVHQHVVYLWSPINKMCSLSLSKVSLTEKNFHYIWCFLHKMDCACTEIVKATFEVGECSEEESGSRGAVGGRACCCETVSLPHGHNETNKETSDKPLNTRVKRSNGIMSKS